MRLSLPPFSKKKQYTLSYRSVVYVVLCSSLFAIIATAIQLYLDYRRDVSALHESFRLIEKSYLPTIARSTFKIDQDHLRLELEGVLKLPDIVYLELQEVRGSQILTHSHGNPNAEKIIRNEFPLEYIDPVGERRSIGTLIVMASLEGVYQRLWSRVVTILVTNVGKTFLASAGILAIIYLLITRHLLRMADFTKHLTPGTKNRLLTLDRNPRDADKPDELEHVVLAINELQERVAADIIKQRQAELKYRTVADFTYDWEHWAKVDGTMEYVSPSCERISGYSVQDFMDNSSLLREIIIQQDHEKWDTHYHNSRREPKPREMQFRIQRRDGQICWIEHSCQPVVDDQGRLNGFRASNRDITARKEMEQGLQQSKEFNQSVLMSLPEHIAVLDNEANILTVNEAWNQFARKNDATFPDGVGSGVNYLRICREAASSGGETVDEAINGLSSVLDGSIKYFEMEYPCDSPTVKRWFLMTVIPFKGRKGGVIVAHSDITQRKLAEMKLRSSFTEIEQLKNQLEAESAYLQEEIQSDHNFENIVGNSDALKYVLHLVSEVASTDAPALILGETGTGKELIARAIHYASSRSKHALFKVNCANLPAALVESELFGHEKGAFTGADSRRIGRFQLADKATLFLDEISEIPIDLQAKLLRVLQDGEFEPVGSSKTIKVDVRIIAASNRSLDDEVSAGRFRSDLLYRINVFPITVPPLRHRKEDIPLLVNWFVDKFSRKMGKRISSIPAALIRHLQNYDWPGNVRELENVIERAVITSKNSVLKLTEKLTANSSKAAFNSSQTLAEVERNHILKILEATGWKIEGNNGAAQILGLAPSTIRSRMKKLGIKRPESN